MSGPAWNDDEPSDLRRIGANSTALVRDLASSAPQRLLPELADVCGWHERLYEGCRVPVHGYAGHFRGDPSVPELVGYEVAAGTKTGVWSARLPEELASLLGGIHAALRRLDAVLPAGGPPTTVEEVRVVVELIAVVHGEWVRLHPFANGNGRTARTWAAFVALRYGLPVFVTLKPRPDGSAYAQAAHGLIGRPPDFRGDRSAAVSVFGQMLRQSLLV